MSTLTTAVHGALPAEQTRKPSLFMRIINGMIDARQREAQRTVNAYLRELDNATLEELGYRPEDIKKR